MNIEPASKPEFSKGRRGKRRLRGRLNRGIVKSPSHKRPALEQFVLLSFGKVRNVRYTYPDQYFLMRQQSSTYKITLGIEQSYLVTGRCHESCSSFFETVYPERAFRIDVQVPNGRKPCTEHRRDAIAHL